MKKSKTRVAAARAAKNLADSTDRFLMRAGQSAEKRMKARNRSRVKTVGKVALMVGAGAATAYAGRALAGRLNGKSKAKSRSSRSK